VTAGAPETVDRFLEGVDPERREALQAVRLLILAAHEGVTEHVKWNGPSICCGGDDRITTGLERKGGIRVILHRGARPKPAPDFRFDDPNGLTIWLAPDRGVVRFTTVADVERCAEAFQDLAGRWFAATSDSEG